MELTPNEHKIMDLICNSLMSRGENSAGLTWGSTTKGTYHYGLRKALRDLISNGFLEEINFITEYETLRESRYFIRFRLTPKGVDLLRQIWGVTPDWLVV